MAESVVVGVRVRPFNDREKKLNAVVCIDMQGPTTIIRDDSDKGTPFTFDESFWSHDGFVDDGTGYNEPAPGSNYADQRYVFEVFGVRVLDNAWAGFHCCLFAYGQTGAGKSYSMVGYGKNKGIVPISCEEIFNRIEHNEDSSKRYEVTVSMIEIYNEAVQDLLILPEDRPKKGLEIRESKLLGIYIDGVVKRPVKDYPEIEACIEEATNHRTVGSTLMNATSSRAHTVQIIEFKQVMMMGGKEQVKISMINLVDLAGSEKAGQTGASGDRLKEGAAINKSLSALGNVIEKLAEKSGGKGKNVIIPYRDSKLTRLLQNALGGSSKTIMICALSPASSNYEETLSTLRYADRAKKIKNNATVNENPQDRLLRELKEENVKLKEMMEQMQKGMVDSSAMAAMAEKQQEIQDVEKELKEMQKSFDQRVAEAKLRENEQRERRRRTTLGLVKSGIAVPQLVNLNEDPQLTGRIKYSLEPGVITRIRGQKSPKSDEDAASGEGSSSQSESDSSDSSRNSTGAHKKDSSVIMLLNDSVFERHATIYNEGGECYLYAEHKAATCTFVNGVSLEAVAKQKEAEASGKLSMGNSGRTLGSIIKRGLKAMKEGSLNLNNSENAESTENAQAQEQALPSGTASEELSAGQGEVPAEEEPPKKEDERSQDKEDEKSKDKEDEKSKDKEDEKGRDEEDEKGKDEEDEKDKDEEDEEKGKEKEDEEGKDDDSKSSDSSSSSSSSSDSSNSEEEKKKQKQQERDALKEKHKKEGHQLKHGDRVVFGKCFFFFVIPGEGIAEVMIMSGVVDFQMASKEMRKMRLKNVAHKIAGTQGIGATPVNPMDFSFARKKLSFNTQPTTSTVRSRNASVTHGADEAAEEDEADDETWSPRSAFSFCAVKTTDFDNMSDQSESEMEETILNLRAQLAQSAATLCQQENFVRLQAQEIKELRAMLVRVGVPELAQPPSRTAPQEGPSRTAPQEGLSPRPKESEAEAPVPRSPRPAPTALLSPTRPVPDMNGKHLVPLKQDAGFSQQVADTFKNALGSLEKVERNLITLMNHGANHPVHDLKKKSVCIVKDVVEVEPEGFDV